MEVRSTDFRVEEGHKVNLEKWPTAVHPIYESKKDYEKLLNQQISQLSSLQQLLYASNRYAVPLIFQAMDAAGKDGAIRQVVSGVNPQGCQVFSYRHPSATELQHDFLWRTTRDLPERGRIGIFNRSYYEEVLIVRVHPEILRKRELKTVTGMAVTMNNPVATNERRENRAIPQPPQARRRHRAAIGASPRSRSQG